MFDPTYGRSDDALTAYTPHAGAFGLPISAFRGATEAANVLNAQFNAYDHSTRAQLQHVTALHQAAEAIRAATATLERERDTFGAYLQAAESRLADVQRVVQRYTGVQEPVVASDGYTYERNVIQQYLDECARQKTQPLSQQTQEVLTAELIPNQSLKKLVELLKAMRIVDGPAGIPGTAGAAAMVSPPMAIPAGATPGGEGTAGGSPALHPCVRVYGFCNYKEACTYASYPFEACLSHLKGKCRFGSTCHELHVDFKRTR